MPNRSSVVISAAVEGLADEALIRRLIEYVGASAGPIYGKQGKGHVVRNLPGYNQSARFRPWIVLLDLNHDDDCAPPFRVSLLPNPSPYMCFRIAVRQIEAWLFADRERLARFLSVASSRIPQDPESLDNPKQTMVNLARQSFDNNDFIDKKEALSPITATINQIWVFTFGIILSINICITKLF